MMYKTILSTMLFLLLSTSAFAKVELYLSNEFKGYDPQEAAQLLERIQQESPDKNILFYIHGRNRDVKDEWESLRVLERNYNLRILMFDWPAWSSLLTRPVKNAEESSVELIPVFEAFKEFKTTHANKKLSLLTHSMGNIVLSYFLENYYSEKSLSYEDGPIFENYISNAADIAMTEHAIWLSKIDFVKRRYVLMNNRDIVLLLSYILDLKNREPFFYKMGLGFLNLPFSGKKVESMLDKKTTYIDLSYTLKSHHRYFENKNNTISQVIDQLVNSRVFAPQEINGTVKVKDKINFVYDK